MNDDAAAVALRAALASSRKRPFQLGGAALAAEGGRARSYRHPSIRITPPIVIAFGPLDLKENCGQDDEGGVGNRTSFVPETGQKTRHRLRTDERQCIENAAEFSDTSNERLEVFLNPNHRQPDAPGAL